MSDEMKEFEVVEAPIEEGGQKAPKKKNLDIYLYF